MNSCVAERFIIAGGTVFDGSGGPPCKDHIAIADQKIVKVGAPSAMPDWWRIDATGHIVTPGFINLVSYAGTRLLETGRAESDLMQGVTTEIIGEGGSLAPASCDAGFASFAALLPALQSARPHVNVASYVDVGTVMEAVMHAVDGTPGNTEFACIIEIIEAAFADGACGLSIALIYPPALCLSADQLQSLFRLAAQWDRPVVAHLRSIGDGIGLSVDEIIRLTMATRARTIIVNFKVAGRNALVNWQDVKRKLGRARDRGADLSISFYPYSVAATDLRLALPVSATRGGVVALKRRLAKPRWRRALKIWLEVAETRRSSGAFWHLMQRPEDMLLLSSFGEATDHARPGATLGAVARERGVSPSEAFLGLLETLSHFGHAAYPLMVPDVIADQSRMPWAIPASDDDAPDLNDEANEIPIHPRCWGSFASQIAAANKGLSGISMAETIHRMTMMPASLVGLNDRGRIAPEMKADIVILRPNDIDVPAVFGASGGNTGVRDVFVNGVAAIRNQAILAKARPGHLIAHKSSHELASATGVR
jgi:N-acyl-D-amino-acid deacylase